MDAVPLAEEDHAILELESETIAGHTCKVARCAGRIQTAELRERVDRGLERTPLLRRRLGAAAGAPAWVPCPDFDIARHVRAAGRVERGDLAAAVARLFEQRLDRSVPLWEIDVLDLGDGGSAIVMRIHHALADGTTAMRLARILLWDDPDPAAKPGRGKPSMSSGDDARRRGHLSRFVAREFGESLHPSPFDGRVGRRRQVAFASIPLHPLHDAAKAVDGATLNDAVLATVAGSLRIWLEHHHDPLGSFRVKVPVSLHRESDDPGNRDSFFTLALPLHERDPIARLHAVRTATAVRKSEHDAERMDSLLTGLRQASPRLEAFAEKLERSPRSFALNVSNVIGPRDPVTVLGGPIDALHSIAEIGRRHALRICVVSYRDTLGFGFCADPAIVDGIETMADGVIVEADSLVAAAGSPG